MVERAGMQHDSTRPMRPRDLYRASEQEAAGALPDKIGRESQKRNFDLLFPASVELEDSFLDPANSQSKNIHSVVVDNRTKLFIRHLKTAEPQPLLPDRSKQFL